MRKQIELICTLSPRHLNGDSIKSFAKHGMTILRLNASHIPEEDLPGILETVNLAKVHSEYPFRVMLDLPGPEFRVFGFDEPQILKERDKIHLCTEGYSHPDITHPFYTNCQDFTKIKLTDTRIKFMGGELEGLPLEFTPNHILVQITREGMLRPNAHINFTQSEQDFTFLSERDLKLSKIGIEYKVDQIALSMVRTREDIIQFQTAVQELHSPYIPEIVAKFETLDSLYHIQPILDISDACFVARGDLGIAIPPEAIPLVQRKILGIATQMHKPVYIATQMLTSMLEHETPTRAEINDIATAILDGAAGITLSEETAIGKYFLAAVDTAVRIIDTTTRFNDSSLPFLFPENTLETDLWNCLTADSFYAPEIRSLSNIGNLIWQRGWAEANAGNLSFKLPFTCDPMTGLVFNAIGQRVTGQADFDFTHYDWYLVSATGSRYRDIEKAGFGNFVLLFQLKPVSETDNASVNIPVYTFPTSRKPTSEWVTHQAVQSWLQKHRKQHHIILHAHPTDWIAIGSLPEYNSDANKLIRDIRAGLPELDIYFPEGIALTSFATPGSQELSDVTVRALENSSVIIWQKHGVFIMAPSFNAAFDSLEIVTKAAQVYLQLRHL